MPSTQPVTPDLNSGSLRHYAKRAPELTGSIIDNSTSVIASYDHDIVRFAMGSPAPDAIPSNLMAALAKQELVSATAYDYAPSGGEVELREQILLLAAQTGRELVEERILVTSGGMQGLDLACKLFIDAGDLVITEAPTYTNGTATITSYQGSVLEIPVDGNGMIVEEMIARVDALARRPKMIYTIPNFQNPSGTTLSLERRERLLAAAADWDAIVIEDDPYGLLRFSGTHLPSLVEMADRPDRVVRVETFSKILAPGLRVGWVEADPRTIGLMLNAKQAMDTCTNLPAQLLVKGFLRDGHMANHLTRLRRVYRERRDAMHDALRASFPKGSMTCTNPAGGMFLWVTLPEQINAATLLPRALDGGVAFIPGSAFSVVGDFRNALRLCFATNDPDRIRDGVGRLRAVIDRVYPGVLAD